MKRVLVCGATGFIGRNIAESLAGRDDLEVHAVGHTRPPYSHDGLNWHQADLLDNKQVTRLLKGMDVIIQAAATTSGSNDIVNRPHIHVTDNVVMNSLLLRAAHDLAVGQFIFFSCSIMYPSSDQPLKETDFDPSAGIHPRYAGAGWTKVYIERMCEFFAGLGRTRHTVIRHSNIYGPHDKFDLERSHMMGATITKVMTASNGKIIVWGSGEEKRDLLYVADLVKFVEMAMDHQDQPFELVNLGTGQAVSVNDLVQTVIQASGRRISVEHDLQAPTIATSLALDCTRAAERYGWSPEIGLNEGLVRTLAWWRANPPTA